MQRVTAMMMAGKGDLLPVSAFPVDGTWPTGTTQWEKRNIALEIPVWDPDICIQCNKCALVCPHAAIRAKVYEPAAARGGARRLASERVPPKDRLTGRGTRLQGASSTPSRWRPRTAPAARSASRSARPRTRPTRATRRSTWSPRCPTPGARAGELRVLPRPARADRTEITIDAKGSQLLQPLFEYSGACAGCGETPYVKLLTQLFGDRLLIANATGCSSIYGGNLPTTPYTTNADGRGPAWSNSLFEDNAEFGLGFRLALDSLSRAGAAAAGADRLAERARRHAGRRFSKPIRRRGRRSHEQRERVEKLRGKARRASTTRGARLLSGSPTTWSTRASGSWAATAGPTTSASAGSTTSWPCHRDVNILVLDTEVYSNTGGQASKATPLGASAKFAVAGKETPRRTSG